MRYFNYAGLSPTRAEAVEEIQAVSDEFRPLLFSESGIAWYRKQVENSRQKVARLLHVNLQFIYCSIDKADRNRITYKSGALENPDCNIKASTILEGTLPAFDNRNAKYIRPA